MPDRLASRGQERASQNRNPGTQALLKEVDASQPLFALRRLNVETLLNGSPGQGVGSCLSSGGKG